MHLFKLPHKVAVGQQHFTHSTATIFEEFIYNALLCWVSSFVGFHAFQSLGDFCSNNWGVEWGGSIIVILRVRFEEVHLNITVHCKYVVIIKMRVAGKECSLAAQFFIITFESICYFSWRRCSTAIRVFDCMKNILHNMLWTQGTNLQPHIPFPQNTVIIEPPVVRLSNCC